MIGNSTTGPAPAGGVRTIAGRRARGVALAALAAVVAVLAALSGCSASPSGQSTPGSRTPTTPPASSTTSSGTSTTSSAPTASIPLAEDVSTVVDGLAAPWSIAFHEATALIAERDSARVLEVTAEGGTRVVGTIEDVVPRGEGGLLGLAVHRGELFTYLTASGENRIVRHALTGRPGALSLADSETILDGLDAASYHNGGRIAFGPDGMLYATVGDARNRSSAQDLTSLSGKILRLSPDGAVPADNPFPGSPVYSYGHRNPQGIAWDEQGTLYASEFGQDTWDELNVIQPGANYGWPEVEGSAGRAGFTDPVQQWAPAEASPSGIAVSGAAVHLANLRGERLRVVPLGELGNAAERFAGRFGRLRDVVLVPDGALWALTSNTDGRGDPAAGDDRVLRIPLD